MWQWKMSPDIARRPQEHRISCDWEQLTPSLLAVLASGCPFSASNLFLETILKLLQIAPSSRPSGILPAVLGFPPLLFLLQLAPEFTNLLLYFVLSPSLRMQDLWVCVHLLIYFYILSFTCLSEHKPREYVFTCGYPIPRTPGRCTINTVWMNVPG